MRRQREAIRQAGLVMRETFRADLVQTVEPYGGGYSKYGSLGLMTDRSPFLYR